MTAFSLGARLPLGANSRLAFSLPQSSLLYPVRLDSFAPSPFSARASAIRSRTCGRQRLAFLAASATGGARKPNPSEGAEAATAAVTPTEGGRTSSVTMPRQWAQHRATFPPKGKTERSVTSVLSSTLRSPHF